MGSETNMKSSDMYLRGSEAMGLPMTLKKAAIDCGVSFKKFDVETEKSGAISAFFFGREQLVSFTVEGESARVDAFKEGITNAVQRWKDDNTVKKGPQYDMSALSKDKLLKQVSQAALKDHVTLEDVKITKEKLAWFSRADHISFTPRGTKHALQDFSTSIGEIKKSLRSFNETKKVTQDKSEGSDLDM